MLNHQHQISLSLQKLVWQHLPCLRNNQIVQVLKPLRVLRYEWVLPHFHLIDVFKLMFSFDYSEQVISFKNRPFYTSLATIVLYLLSFLWTQTYTTSMIPVLAVVTLDHELFILLLFFVVTQAVKLDVLVYIAFKSWVTASFPLIRSVIHITVPLPASKKT